MVHPARFELATPGSEDQCSNPLSYGCKYASFCLDCEGKPKQQLPKSTGVIVAYIF